MMCPLADDFIGARNMRGCYLRRASFGHRRLSGLMDLKVNFDRHDTANLMDLEGVDFDVINKDLLDYYHDCED